MSSFSLPYHPLAVPLSNMRTSAGDSGSAADDMADEAPELSSTAANLYASDEGPMDAHDYDGLPYDFSLAPVSYPQHPLTPPYMLYPDTADCSPSSSFGAVEDIIPPTTPEPPLLYLTEEYKALADPLSLWIADYLWKAVDAPSSGRPSPANRLAKSIQGVLWSTMLQPSAIFLALWYLSRLPADCVLPARATQDQTIAKFRSILFKSDVMTEEYACHRLFLCVAMLADRELHDNCFSSATWSEISAVPSADLAGLEFCALNMLEHSLWLSPGAYREWVQAIKRYHARLPAGLFLTASGTDGHAIVSLQIDHVLSTLSAQVSEPVPEPVFIRPGERLLVPEEPAVEEDSDSDIDLDEDGPLRAEYIPRRSAQRFSLDYRATVSRGTGAKLLEESRYQHYRRSSLLELTLDTPASQSPTYTPTPAPEPERAGHKSWKSIDSNASDLSSASFSSLAQWASARSDHSHSASLVRPQWLRA